MATPNKVSFTIPSPSRAVGSIGNFDGEVGGVVIILLAEESASPASFTPSFSTSNLARSCAHLHQGKLRHQENTIIKLPSFFSGVQLLINHNELIHDHKSLIIVFHPGEAPIFHSKVRVHVEEGSLNGEVDLMFILLECGKGIIVLLKLYLTCRLFLLLFAILL